MPYSEDAYVRDDESQRHSGLGIASFVIAILAGLTEIGIIVAASMMAADNRGELDEQSPQLMAMAVGFCGGVIIALVGIGLGIAGLVQSDRRKLFAILGLILNSVIVLGIAGLTVLALIAKAHQ